MFFFFNEDNSKNQTGSREQVYLRVFCKCIEYEGNN